MKPLPYFLICVLTMSSAVPVLPQTPAAQQQSDDRIVSGTAEVVLDAVVKDKKGRPVKDLQASDFQVFEDGKPQDVRSFRLVSGGTTAIAAPGTNASSSSRRTVLEEFSSGRLGAVALIFDRLSADSRKQARDTALSYVGNGLEATDFVGVFGIDQTLSVVQAFTSDTQLVKQAIDRASGANSTVASVTSEQIGEMAQKVGDAQKQLTLAEIGAEAAQSANSAGGQALNAEMRRFALRSAEDFERMEQTQKGQATTHGLLAVIAAMSVVPGRKAIIFFSEGVAIPVATQANFQNVIGNANRANVSIYAVDAAGLRATSSDADLGKQLSLLGQQRAAQAGSARDSGGSMMRDSERNEELVRKNPETGLGQLADQTGGMLISGTNNPGARLRQVNEDLHTYYVLTYSPKNQVFDGKFRQISVKVNRGGTDVQARKGYYGLATTYKSPVLSFEAPALAILERKTQPNGFLTRGAAFSFPEGGKPGLVPVLVDIPASAINFVSNAATKTYRTDFTVVALLKDESQHVSRKLSNQYLLSGPLDQLDTARKGNVLFYSETELEPGQYTFDSIVYDASNQQSSVNHSSFTVGEADQNRLRVSSLVVVSKAQKLPPADQIQTPFKVGDLLLYPNLGEALQKSTSKGLSFFITAYLPKGATATPKMTIELDQGGRALGQLPMDLPAPDQNGRIQYTGTLPLDAFPPGEYELKASITDAVTKATRSVRFVVQP